MKPKLVMVWWFDAEDGVGWEKFSKIRDSELPLCCSVGFFVSEDKDKIAISHGFHDDEGIGFTLIPKGMIQKRKFVKY